MEVHLAREVLNLTDHVRGKIQLLKHDAVLEPANLLDLVAVEMQFLHLVAARRTISRSEETQ